MLLGMDVSWDAIVRRPPYGSAGDRAMRAARPAAASTKARKALLPVPDAAAATWIARRDTLDAWLAGRPAGAARGVDTEFMRRNTFHPQLALLQLGWKGRYALVDPLAFDIGDALRPWLGAGSVVTVMHSAGEDLEALAPLLPDGPATLFDTQVAAAFVGMGLG